MQILLMDCVIYNIYIRIWQAITNMNYCINETHMNRIGVSKRVTAFRKVVHTGVYGKVFRCNVCSKKQNLTGSDARRVSCCIKESLVTVVCSLVGLLSFWHIPYFHSQFYLPCTFFVPADNDRINEQLSFTWYGSLRYKYRYTVEITNYCQVSIVPLLSMSINTGHFNNYRIESSEFNFFFKRALQIPVQLLIFLKQKIYLIFFF